MKILYEDNHIIAAVKPHMVPTQADISGDADMLTMVKNYVKEKYSKPGNVYIGLVHRLDRPAGGVMIFARTSKAASRLSAQISSGTTQKTYFAITTALPKDNVLEDYLKKDARTNTVKSVPKGTPGAKYASLDWSLAGEANGKYLLKIHLHTGRAHQIRVQLASRGCPIFGDAKYGNAEGAHLALWSYSFEFDHPTTKKRLTILDKPLHKPFDIFFK